MQRLREDLIHPDALLDCLVEICRLQGHPTTRAALSAGLPIGTETQGRLPLDLVERAAARAGMATRLQRQALDGIDSVTLPVLLILHENQACVLLGWDGDEARVLLPETGQGAVRLARTELAARYSGVVLFVRPHFRFDAGAQTPPERTATEQHWFWSALLAQRFVYRDVLWAALLINLFALVFPMFSMNIYDRVVPNNAFETLWSLSIGVLLVLGADLFMRLLRSHFVDEASARIDVALSAKLMEKVLGLRLEHRPESVGSFAQNLRGFEQVRDFIASSTVTALIDLPFALLFVVVLAWISPWLAVPVLVAFSIILVLGYFLQHRLHALSETTYQASAQRNATLIESLSAIETIKSQGAEKRHPVEVGAGQPVSRRHQRQDARPVFGCDVRDQHADPARGGLHDRDRRLPDQPARADDGRADRRQHALGPCAGACRTDRRSADAVPGRAHSARIAEQDHGETSGRQTRTSSSCPSCEVTSSSATSGSPTPAEPIRPSRASASRSPPVNASR